MWPWGHLALAYLCFVGYTHLRDDARQTPLTVGAVVVASQLPDLVDKTFAWSFTLLPSGRSLGHSLITAAVIVAILAHVASRLEHRTAVAAVAIGLVSHDLIDVGPYHIADLLTGDPSQLQWATYLVWPLLAPPPYPHDESFAYHFDTLALDPYMTFQFALFGFAVVVWVASGAPGLGRLRKRTVSFTPE